MLRAAIALVLVRQYVRTKEAGWIWLGVATEIWPFASNLFIRNAGGILKFVESHILSAGGFTRGQLFELVALLQNAIGVGLLLVAVMYLGRMKRGADRFMSDGRAI